MGRVLRSGSLVVGSLVSGFLLLHLVVLAVSDVHLNWRGSDFTVQNAGDVVISSNADGIALRRTGGQKPIILTAASRWVDAALYDRAIVRLEGGSPRPSVVLAWARVEQPGKIHSAPMRLDASGRYVLDLRTQPEWKSRVTQLGIVVLGDRADPFTLNALTLLFRDAGMARRFVHLWQGWAALEGWSLASVNFTISGRGQLPSPVMAAGIWIILSCAIYLLVAWRFRIRTSIVALTIILFAGWLLLDLRWQMDMLHQNISTWKTFRGKSTAAEKRDAEWGGSLFRAVDEAKAFMDAVPQRLIIFTDLRGAIPSYLVYHSIPHNAVVTAAPDPESFRTGDYILVVPPASSVYQPQESRLVWVYPSYGTGAVPVDLVGSRPQRFALFRVRKSD
jgi:hypothetical protein